jgi:hypothetical protein
MSDGPDWAVRCGHKSVATVAGQKALAPQRWVERKVIWVRPWAVFPPAGGYRGGVSRCAAPALGSASSTARSRTA